MNVEILRVVYKGMGWLPALTLLGSGESDLIYPPVNAEQCMEIMEKLKISIQWLDGDKYGYWFSVSHEVKGKTINEAVILAAYEYFK